MARPRAASPAEPRRLRLRLRHCDFFEQALEFAWPAGTDRERLEASVVATQPCGYCQQVTAQAVRSGDGGRIVFEYPLIDEGKYGPVRRGLWKMGRYRFEVELREGAGAVAAGRVSLNPDRLFGKIGGMRLAQVDSLRQFIECVPDRPVFTEPERIGFAIRTLPDRVPSCAVTVDVVRPKGDAPLAGPLELDLTGRVQGRTLDAVGWPRGEYWLRVRLLREGRSAGPYLIRPFRIETSRELRAPEQPLRIGDRPQYMVDDWLFAAAQGLRHRPVQLERLSDGPVVELDRPWEKGPVRTSAQYFAWDGLAGQFRLTYYAGPISQDPTLWTKGTPGMVAGTSNRYLCLAVSGDGVHWEKPDVGRVEFAGSRRNNILRDRAAEDFLGSGEFDSYPYPTKERPIPSKYHSRFYDAETDGPTDMDRFVFRYFNRRNLEPEGQFSGGFRPGRGEFWGFERRGDLFLALTHRPVLIEGHGPHLGFSSERASTYPFTAEAAAGAYPGGGSTAIFYDRRSKTFYYYFRPEFPAHPPHGLPYYLWHGIAAIRTRAVMWTRDGVHWERRHILCPDEHDPPGLTLYGFGFVRPAGGSGSDTDGQLHLGTLFHWDLATQVTRHELIWSRDLIHWHRFGANRQALLPNGPAGSWDTSYGGLATYHTVTGSNGEEEWWFPYHVLNHRYMLGGKAEGLEALKAEHPYYELAPFFTSWEDFYQEKRQAVSLPALARCRAGRLACVEPDDGRGELTTHALCAEGSRLLVNARTGDGGHLRAEVLDSEDHVLPGFALEDCIPFSGDRAAHQIRWKRARLEEVNRRVIRLRLELVGAQLYSFRIAP